jgi:hypothetical protein
MQRKMNSRAPMPAFALMAAATVLGFAGSAQAKALVPPVGGDPPSICDAVARNLVTNCGFETGDFTGWTETPAATGSLFGVDGFPNSGEDAAFFGATDPPDEDMISQSISTIAGQAYNITFFLSNFVEHPGEPSTNQFTAMFDGTTLLSLTNSDGFPYTEFTDTVVATSTSTTLRFDAYQVLDFYLLDDVSVTAVSEPASLALLGSALLAFGVGRRRRAAV